MLHERGGKIGAAKDEQVLAGLLLQFGDFLLGILFHQPRILPFRFSSVLEKTTLGMLFMKPFSEDQ